MHGSAAKGSVWQSRATIMLDDIERANMITIVVTLRTGNAERRCLRSGLCHLL